MNLDFAKARYIPSLATQKKIMPIFPFTGEFEQLYVTPHSANRANTVVVPAEQTPDIQTFLFGPMSHSITLRPYRQESSCCSCTNVHKFDLAVDAFGPTFGEGEIGDGCCSNIVTVNLPNTTLRGEISKACCTMQQRTTLQWQTGEDMSLRAPPCIPCCGPWRTGFVGTAPGEEEQHNIRYWSLNGMFIDCTMGLCCGYCRGCCTGCDCPDEVGYTTWLPPSLDELRGYMLSKYSFALQSSFGEPVFEKEGPYTLVGTVAGPHKSDVNALGHMRIRERQNACCKWVMSDPSDTSDTSASTGFDLTFRGTFNQNQLDSKDFNLALGYLILNTKFFMDVVAVGTIPHMAAVQTLPGAMFLLHRADVRPNHAVTGGNKMV